MNITSKILMLLFAVFIVSFSPALSTAERYDQILKELEEGPKEIKTYQDMLPPSQGEKIPKLSGIWILKKTTIRRMQPALIVPVHNTFCNAVLPIDKWDFERKVVISEQVPGKFVIRNLHPHTFDVYEFPRERDIVYSSDKRNSYPDLNSDSIIYQNFGFKGVIDPEDLTYSYTLRLVNFRENQNLAREIWFRSRVNYEKVSGRYIEAKGYETYETPWCHGFVRDDVKIQLKKIKSFEEKDNSILANAPIVFEEDISVDIPEVKNRFPSSYKTLKAFDSAKDKSGFKPNPKYEPIDTTTLPKYIKSDKSTKPEPMPKVKVPGMW